MTRQQRVEREAQVVFSILWKQTFLLTKREWTNYTKSGKEDCRRIARHVLRRIEKAHGEGFTEGARRQMENESREAELKRNWQSDSGVF